MKKENLQAIWVFLSVATALAGQYQVYILKHPLTSAVFFILSAVLMAAGAGIRNERQELELRDSTGVPAGRTEIILFVIILITACFFRLYDISNVPYGCHRDEAKAVLDSSDIMNGVRPYEGNADLPVYIRSLTDNPAMYNYVIAGFFRIFGAGIDQARVISALTGILAVVSMYFLLRYLFGPAAAVAGGFLFATMRWPSIFSRIIYHSGFSVLFTVLVLYFAYRSYFSRKWWDFVLLGISLTLGLNTYHATRALPAGLIACGLYIAAVDLDFYRKNILKIILGFMVCVITFLPLGTYIMRDYKNFMARPREMFVLSEKQMQARGTGENRVQVYLSNLKKGLLMYNMYGDLNITYNVDSMPMAGYVTGALAASGFIYMLILALAGSRLAALTVILFLVYLHGTVLFIETPHAARAILTLPFPVIFAAVILRRMAVYLKNGRASRIFTAVSLAALIAFQSADDYNTLFNRWGKSPHIYIGFDSEMRSATGYFKSRGAGWKGIFPDDYLHDYVMRGFEFRAAMLNCANKDYESFQLGANLPAVPPFDKGIIYFFPDEQLSMLPLLQEYYPQGKFNPFYRKNEPGVMSYFTFEVDKTQLENPGKPSGKNGLTARYYSSFDFSGKPAMKRTDPVLNYFWLKPEPFAFASAEWNTKLKIDSAGRYYFYIYSRDESALYIDGKPVFENMGPNHIWRGEGAIDLKPGIHNVHIRYRYGPDRRISFWWNGPGTDGEKPVPYIRLFPAE